jgi:hypothetical protein
VVACCKTDGPCGPNPAAACQIWFRCSCQRRVTKQHTSCTKAVPGQLHLLSNCARRINSCGTPCPDCSCCSGADSASTVLPSCPPQHPVQTCTQVATTAALGSENKPACHDDLDITLDNQQYRGVSSDQAPSCHSEPKGLGPLRHAFSSYASEALTATIITALADHVT